jgi:transcription initiation factor TFIIB
VLNERNVDYSHSGKRAYTSQERDAREHTGAPISELLPDIGLTTFIDKKNITDPDLKRAAKWNTRMSWEKRNILIATTELKRICTNLNIPNHVRVEAMRLYKEAFKLKLLRGRSINAMVAACVYFAIRFKQIPRTFQEVLDESSETAKNVRRSYRAIVSELRLKAPNMDPNALVPKYISKLNLDQNISKTTNDIITKFSANFETSGKDPKGIVAGALYLAVKMNNLAFTQKEIADSVGITEVTLRSRYKELKTKLKIQI